jgi:ADP-heptose:LPS heptosyltransferase
MVQNVIFQISGGLGKSIMATAVLKVIKNEYKKANIIVVTSFPDVFIGNPNVNKVLHEQQAVGLYQNYIHNKNTKVFISDPYLTSDFITESNHLIKIWCELYGLKYNGESPEIFISKGEKEYFAPFYQLDKPIMAIQPNGGAVGQPLKYSWTRDLPISVVNEVVSQFKNDYAILHIKREDQLKYENTIGALDSWRSIAIMLTLSSKRLLIDSSSMHIASALNLPSVVGWIGTNPSVFGYDLHTNMKANEPTKEVNFQSNAYTKHLLFEDISTMPYNDFSEIFDTQSIINALKSDYLYS